MEEADLLLKWTENLKSEIKKLPFKENDIRRDFYGMIYDATYNYYRLYVCYKISEYIKCGQVAFGSELSNDEKHIKRIAETSTHPTLAKSQMNYFNRHLLSDVWSTFELCVTCLVDAISNKDEKEKILNHHFNDIRKCTAKSNFDENDKAKLYALTCKTHLTHVPITRKTDFLFTKARHYYRDSNADKNYLLFLGKWRNTMHTNYIYYGKDYEYKFGDAHFKFEDGKIVKWYDPFEPTPRLYFYLVGNLKEIWTVLVKCIKHNEIIAYPDNDQE